MTGFLAGRIRSFGYALRGIGTMLRSQRNAWLHALATGVVVAAGLALGVSADGWKWLVLAIVTVWSAEALNTALEFLADAATDVARNHNNNATVSGVTDARDLADVTPYE